MLSEDQSSPQLKGALRGVDVLCSNCRSQMSKPVPVTNIEFRLGVKEKLGAFPISALDSSRRWNTG